MWFRNAGGLTFRLPLPLSSIMNSSKVAHWTVDWQVGRQAWSDRRDARSPFSRCNRAEQQSLRAEP